jgi:hypothetical protein
MNIKNKPIQWLLAAILTTSCGYLIAQPVILNPLATGEASYGFGVASMGNNTGNDICLLPALPPNDMVNVMVYESLPIGTINLTHQYAAFNIPGINVAIGSTLPPGTVFSDPDVTSVVSSGTGLGGLKQRIMVTYIAQVPSFAPRVYLEMYNWTGSTFTLVGGPYDLSISGGVQTCKTPNIDADYLGNYAVVWEEGAHIYMTSANSLTTWTNPPTMSIDHSSACGILGDEKEPDVCLIPEGVISLINVTFKRNSEIFVERIWTNQLLPGLNPFPTSNCVSPMFYTQSIAPRYPSDLRIACPPTGTLSRNIFDMSIAFTMTFGGNVDIVTASHDFSTYGLGVFAFNMVNSSGSGSFPATGPNYINRKPAIAYKLMPDEFVVAWELTDNNTGMSNAYSPPNNNANLVAVRCSDANNPLNIDMSSVDLVNPGITATSISISKGDITRMQYGFIKNSNTTRYNSIFPGLNLKKENPGKLWFVDYSQVATSVPDVDQNSNIQMYPNPVAFNSGDIHIELKNTQASEISILTIDGKQVYHIDIENQSSITIPNQFPKGAYFVVIQSNENKTTQKLMIQ